MGFGGTKKVEREMEQRRTVRETERRGGGEGDIESRKNETG